MFWHSQQKNLLSSRIGKKIAQNRKRCTDVSSPQYDLLVKLIQVCLVLSVHWYSQCEYLKERNCALGTGKSSFMIFNWFSVSIIMIKERICKFVSNRLRIVIRWVISSHYTEHKCNFKILLYGFLKTWEVSRPLSFLIIYSEYLYIQKISTKTDHFLYSL